MDERKLCECGCGEAIRPQRHHRYHNVRFIQGHQSRVAKGHVYTPTPEEIPSGICECGCGGRTNIAKRTQSGKRHFMGYPVPFCPKHSIHKKGPESPAWKGGRIVTSGGYITVWCPDHPNADHLGYVLEHRLVMERELGRPLEKGEIVHHINHVKDDNRPENLMLVSAEEHMVLHKTRLTDSEAEEVWLLTNFGHSYREMADRFGVPWSTIRSTVRRKQNAATCLSPC